MESQRVTLSYRLEEHRRPKGRIHATGIEPATGFPFNRLVERKYGRVPKLAPGESRNFTLDFGIHLGKEEVDPLIAESTELQTQATIELIPTPPATE